MSNKMNGGQGKKKEAPGGDKISDKDIQHQRMVTIQ